VLCNKHLKNSAPQEARRLKPLGFFLFALSGPSTDGFSEHIFKIDTGLALATEGNFAAGLFANTKSEFRNARL